MSSHQQKRPKAQRPSSSAVAQAARRRRLIALAVALVAVLAVAFVVLLAPGKQSSTAPATSAQVSGQALAAEEFGGIEQHGLYLGNPKAAYELVEYSDLQCPACKLWSDSIVPTVINDLVRTGKVRFSMRAVGILGDDSTAAEAYAGAAAKQNKLQEFVKVWYLNQGQENSGYVSDAFARNVASAVPGLDAGKLIADSKDAAVIAVGERSRNDFIEQGFNSVPTFVFGRAGGTLVKVDMGSGDGASAVQALKARMSSAR